MAEILNGFSHQKSHAPLSADDTIAVCRHLEGLISQVSKQIQEMKGDSQSMGGGVDSLKKALAVTNHDLHALRDDLTSTNSRQHAMGVKVEQNTESCKQLKVGVVKANEAIELLRDGQKMTNTNVQNVKDELKQKGEDLNNLHQNLDQLTHRTGSAEQQIQFIEKNIEKMLDDQASSQKGLGSCKETLAQLTAGMRQAKESISDLGSKLGVQGKQMEKLSVSVDGTRSNLEITNGVVMKLHEGHETTKSNLSSLQDDSSGHALKLQLLFEELSKTSKTAESVHEDLSVAKEAHEQTRKAVGKALGQLQLLQEDHAKSGRSMAAVEKHLEQVHKLANETRQDLDTTNSLALPNLKSEGIVSPRISKSWAKSTGSSVSTHPTQYSKKGPPVPSSPRRKRSESLWTSRNIGLVPDRMSWI